MIENVEFDQESIGRVALSQKKTGLASFLIHAGIAKNNEQATIVMFAIIIVCLCIMAVAIYIVVSPPSRSGPPQPDADALLPPKARNR